MSEHYTAVICHKGHIITDTLEKNFNLFDSHCSKCGSPTTHKCEHCGTLIRGAYILNFECEQSLDKLHLYCHNCGKAYPWTILALDKGKQIIEEDEKLSNKMKQQLIEVLPDMMTETPSTNLAFSRLKKFFATAAKDSCTAFISYITEYGCQALKALLKL